MYLKLFVLSLELAALIVTGIVLEILWHKDTKRFKAKMSGKKLKKNKNHL